MSQMTGDRAWMACGKLKIPPVVAACVQAETGIGGAGGGSIGGHGRVLFFGRVTSGTGSRSACVEVVTTSIWTGTYHKY